MFNNRVWNRMQHTSYKNVLVNSANLHFSMLCAFQSTWALAKIHEALENNTCFCVSGYKLPQREASNPFYRTEDLTCVQIYDLLMAIAWVTSEDWVLNSSVVEKFCKLKHTWLVNLQAGVNIWIVREDRHSQTNY